MPIIQQAIAQRSMVSLECHFPIDKCNKADLQLFGRFIKITGQQAQFETEKYDFGPGSSFPAAPECDYTLGVMTPRSDGKPALVQYGGRATILDQELGDNDLPLGLLLRMGAPSRVRPMRRHARGKNPEGVLMPGLMLIDTPPRNRRQLLDALAYYYRQKSRPRPRLVDISAGGACLETEDSVCLRIMGAEEHYLFFFFSASDTEPRFPHVFLARKVGLFRSGQTRHAGLRIRFLKELSWSDPMQELQWNEVSDDGSQTVAALLSSPEQKSRKGRS